MLISRKIGWLVLLVLSSNALSGMQGFAYTTFRRTPQLTEGTVLERTIFEEVDFSNLNVENMGFNDCVFRECIFTRAKLRKVIFNNCKFYSCFKESPKEVLNLSDSVVWGRAIKKLAGSDVSAQQRVVSKAIDACKFTKIKDKDASKMLEAFHAVRASGIADQKKE